MPCRRRRPPYHLSSPTVAERPGQGYIGCRIFRPVLQPDLGLLTLDGVALVEQALGEWRHEFTSALAEVPHVWVGPGPRLIENLEELKKALSAASDGAVVARFSAEGGFRFSP